MTRLDKLRSEFDRLTKAAEEHGYAEYQQKLEEISRDIRQEEIAQRFAYGHSHDKEKDNGTTKTSESIQRMV